jgi:hypothetical protein
VLEEAYTTTLNQILPQVEAGLSSPRDSPIPMTPLTRIGVAKRMFDEGDVEGAQIYLLAGLKGWFVRHRRHQNDGDLPRISGR